MQSLRFLPPSTESLDSAADLVISACRRAFGNNLVCVTLKGSAARGDFIRGYSDFDFHIYVKPEAMDGDRTPKAAYAIEFQRAFGHVNPEDFGVSQFQIYFLNSESYPSDWLPPIEGTYRVLWGQHSALTHDSRKEDANEIARQHLAGLADAGRSIVGRFVDKPDTRIVDIVRLLGTTLKGYMYSALVLMCESPEQAFSLDLNGMIQVMERDTGSGHFRGFFRHVNDWTEVRNDPEKARTAFAEGLEALQDIGQWFAHLN